MVVKGESDLDLNIPLTIHPEPRDSPLSRFWSPPSSPRFERGPKVPVLEDVDILGLYAKQEPKADGTASVKFVPL